MAERRIYTPSVKIQASRVRVPILVGCLLGAVVLGSGPLWSSQISIRSDEDLSDNQPAQQTQQPAATPSVPSGAETPSAPNENAEQAETNLLFRRRAAQIQELGPAASEEMKLMAAAVQLLDRESATQWLAGFISSPPLNCPLSEKKKWIDAILNAVERNGLPLSKEITGLVACIISIESGFRADPLAVDPSGRETIADLLRRAEEQLQQKTGSILQTPPLAGLYAEYRNRYYSRLLSCRTEGDVEVVARSIAGQLKRDCRNLPPFMRKIVNRNIDRLCQVVRTKGSMQLNFNRARQVMKDRDERFIDQELLDYMYTCQGGVDVGVAALKPMFVQYAARYATPGDLSWLFFVGMDYHYGPFSSRNMMEQIRIRDLSGARIALDGDLLHYDEDGTPLDKDSQTLQALRTAFPSVSRDEIFQAFLLEKDPHYIYTNVHRILSEAHQERFGETPFAVIGELWMGQEAQVKHGSMWKTKAYLKKLDRYLNSIPWDSSPQ
ncbi:MAG: DUF1615 family protein [Thermodesulfobacteriota bacterium]